MKKKEERQSGEQDEECIPTVAGQPKGTRPCDLFTPSPTTVYVMVEKNDQRGKLADRY